MRKDLPFFILLLLFLASCLSGYFTTQNYVSATRAAHGIKIELENLRLDLEEKTTANLTFNISNPSSVKAQLNRLSFSLYVNGRFVGVYDYLKTTEIEPGRGRIEVVAEIHPIYAKEIYEEKQQDTLLWFIDGRAIIALPYKDFVFLLDVREYFAGG